MKPGFITLATALFALHGNLYAQPLFDAHLHYNEADARVFTPQQVTDILERQHIQHAVVTSTPPQHAARLFAHDPQRIIPFLGIYRQAENKQNWHQDADLPGYIEQQIKAGPWQGIGELHIFARHRHSPVFHRLVNLATRYKLPLLMHSDPAVIDTIFELEPGATVIWAHAGAYPYPELLDDYLTRYPGLYVDLSVRDERIAPDGVIADEWYNLFIRYPDRFLVGVDTFSMQRWKEYGKVAGTIRNWLSQIPPDVASRIAFDNAEALFQPGPVKTAD